MGRKEHKMKEKTKIGNNSNKGVRKHIAKSNIKSNKKKIQLQIKKLDTLDIEFSEIANATKTNPKEGSLQTRKLMEHHAEDKETTARISKDKEKTEQKIKEQVDLISSFSIL